MIDARLQAVGETALDRFIESFNTRDPKSWAASLSYPHVRVSPRQAVAETVPDEDAYAGAVSYDAADAMGWHHSAWDAKRVLATSPSKIHASAQWCRFDAAGGRIVENNVSYVITRVEDRWGIQARFGVDSRPPADVGAAAGRAREAWQRFWEAVLRQDSGGVAAATRLPLNVVGVGRVTRAATPAEVIDGLRDAAGGATFADAEALQVGGRGVNLAADLSITDGGDHHVVGLVVLSDSDARVSALSLL